MVYPTGMAYLHDAVCVLCGLLLSIHDFRTRRVPRIWVAVCLVLQNIAAAVAYVFAQDMVISRFKLFRAAASVLFPRTSVQDISQSWSSGVALVTVTLGLALVLSLLQSGIMLLLALIRPGSLGFGDVTATLLFTNALALHGCWIVLLWWLLSGVFGLIALWFWKTISISPFQSHRSSKKSSTNNSHSIIVHATTSRPGNSSATESLYKQNLAFVPVLYAGTITSILLAIV